MVQDTYNEGNLHCKILFKWGLFSFEQLAFFDKRDINSVHLEMRLNNGSRVNVLFSTLWEFQPDEYFRVPRYIPLPIHPMHRKKMARVVIVNTSPGTPAGVYIARNFGRSLAIPGQFCKRPSHFPRTRP